MISAAVVDLRLRRALLGLAGLMFLGTTFELWLVDHTETRIQMIPFVLCGLGVLAVAGVLLSAQPVTVLFLRGVMLLVIAGSSLGMYEHLAGNFAFELEIRPNVTASDVLLDALKGGNPLLAPGMLAVAGAIALIATYSHPGVIRQES